MAGQYLGDTEVKIDKISSTDGVADLDIDSRRIVNLADPSSPKDATTKTYVDKAKTSYTVGKNDTTADFNTADYANDSLAIAAAITAASASSKIRHVLVKGDSSTVYTLGDTTLLLPSNFTLEATPGVTFKLKDNASGTNPVGIKNLDQINGNVNITLKNITGDGNGANQIAAQSTGGVFLNFTGVQNLVYDTVNIYDSVRYNSFIGITTGAALTGTMTFTKDSLTVSGSGTAFTSELQVGQRIRSDGGNLSAPILSIASDTSLTFVAPWPHATESGVSSNTVADGVRIKVKNSRFGRTYEDDTFGGGGWDDSEFSDCYFEDSEGYGFGSTAMDNSTVVNCISNNCQNGFGLERVTNTSFTNCHAFGAASKGFNTINGCYNNTYTNCHATACADGFYDANTSATKGQNSNNTYSSCKAYSNTNNGFNFAGTARPKLIGCSAFNNSTSGAGTYYGFVFQDANGYNTTYPEIRGCSGYDTQSSQTQTKDIHFTAGATNAIVDFTGFTVISGISLPTYSANMKIIGGGKQISIISGSSRTTANYENYVLCNQDTFAFTLPRLDSIVDGHKVKYIYNGAGTPSWTFARSASDSFGTLEDYTQIPQDGHFWVEWCWDNSTKRWFISGTNHTASLATKVSLGGDLGGTVTTPLTLSRTAKVTVGNAGADFNIASGSDASTTFTNAIAALTGGRTFVETVYIRGNFTIDAHVVVPSYTRVVLDGTITTTTLRPSGATNWSNNMGVFELGDRTTKPTTYQASVVFTPGSKIVGDYFNTSASSYPQEKVNSAAAGFTDATLLNQKDVSAVHSYCTLIDCETKGVAVENMHGAVRFETLGRTNGTPSKGNKIIDTRGRHTVIVVEAYTNGYQSDDIQILNTSGDYCIDDIVAVIGADGGVPGAGGINKGITIDGVYGHKNGLRGSAVKLDGGSMLSGLGQVRDVLVENVNVSTTQAALSGVVASENVTYMVLMGNTSSRNITYNNISGSGNWRFGARTDTSGVDLAFNNWYSESLHGIILKSPNVPSDAQKVSLSNVSLVQRNTNVGEAGSRGIAIMGGDSVQGFKNVTIRNTKARYFEKPLVERGISGVGVDGTILSVDYEIDVMDKTVGDVDLTSTDRQIILKKNGKVLSDTHVNFIRDTVTVGSNEADYVYDTGMTPIHYADAINSALSSASNGKVSLRGETVAFTSASGKVVTPLSNIAIRGSGIDKTVINTARTDYVFKYTNTGTVLTNATLSDMTISCQDIATVSGIDIRNFDNYRLERVKFTNSTQWFARFGNEPSSSSSVISDKVTVEDCIFDTHNGIYEMLLAYNARFIDINRSTFKNKTGSAGAAPTIGIWQKVNYARIRNCTFQDLVSSAIYYAYTTNKIKIQNSDFINTGQGIRGANVSDHGKFSTTMVDNIDVDRCNFIGGSNSLTTEAVQLGSVKDFTVSNSYISTYGKGIRIGYGNTTPTASDGGDAFYPSTRGRIDKVTFENINSNGNDVNLNSPIYFGNGGDFGNLVISNITVVDPNDYLDYAVIFNGGTSATASVSGGAVTGITTTNTFGWYSTAPTVTITGDGTNATATATINSDGQVTGYTITNGGTGYTTATVAVTGANYKNITFLNCDFGGKQIRVNNAAQLETSTIKFINCRNFDTTNLSAAFLDASVFNTTGLIQHDGKLGVAMGTSALSSNTDFQVGNGSAVATIRHNNIRQTNSNDNLQTIFSNFASKTWIWYKNNTDLSSRKFIFDVDSGKITPMGGVGVRVGTVTSSATPSINTDLYDQYNITALATSVTSMTTNLTGTPTDAQKLVIRFKDNGTARTITWGASFISSGSATLPSTTVINKTMMVGFIYDSVAAAWVCMAVDAIGY